MSISRGGDGLSQPLGGIDAGIKKSACSENVKIKRKCVRTTDAVELHRVRLADSNSQLLDTRL